MHTRTHAHTPCTHAHAHARTHTRVCVRACVLTYGSNGPAQEGLSSKSSAVPEHVLEVLLAEVDRTSQTSGDGTQDVPVLLTHLVLMLRQESLAIVHVTVGWR